MTTHIMTTTAKLQVAELVAASNSSYCVAPRPISDGGVGAAIFFATAALFAPLPQVIAIVRKKSSAGVSHFTLTLCMCYMTFNVASSILTKWSTLQACSIDTNACAIHLLDVLQQVNANIAYVCLLVTLTAYPPQSSWRRKIATYVSFALLAAVLVGVCLISARQPCTLETKRASEYLASAAGLMVIVAFVPQLVETWRREGRGSISFLFFAIQAVGCLLIAATNAVAFHDSPTTWAPYVVGGAIQAAIVSLGGYFWCCRRRRTEAHDATVASAWRGQAGATLLPASALSSGGTPQAERAGEHANGMT